MRPVFHLGIEMPKGNPNEPTAEKRNGKYFNGIIFFLLRNMKPITHFNIVLAAISIILVIVGSALLGKSDYGNYILYAGLFVGTVFTISSIIDVFRSKTVRPSRKIVWLIMVICVPVVGGLLYYVIEYGKSSSDVISTPDYEDSF